MKSWPVYLVASIAGMLITARMIWPSVHFDTTSLILLAVGVFAVLLPHLSRYVARLTVGGASVELREKIEVQQTQIVAQRLLIDRQNEILRKIVAFSMSFHIYQHLKELHKKSKLPGDKYLYRNYHERDFYFLRDHGYIESKKGGFLQIEELVPDTTNLLDVVVLTPAGEFSVQLREENEARTALPNTAAP